jgi:hypothetical protein
LQSHVPALSLVVSVSLIVSGAALAQQAHAPSHNITASARTQASASPAAIAGDWQLDAALSKAPGGGSPQMERYEHAWRGGRERHAAPIGGQGLGGPFAAAPTPAAESSQAPSETSTRGQFRGRGQREGMARGRGFFGPIENLHIEIDATHFHVTGDEGRDRMLALDGTPFVREGRRRRVVQKATVQGAKVVVTNTTDDGRVITETYALADDGSGRMIHTVDAQGGLSPPMSARWVYERAAHASLPTATAPAALPPAAAPAKAPTPTPAPANAPVK